MADAASPVTVNITAGEILPPGASIELKSVRAIEPRWAQGSLQLFHHGAPHPLTVEVAARSKTIRISTQQLEPGAYQLVVSELLGAKGERLVDRLVVPFSIAPISGDVPRDLRVEHAARLAIGDLTVERLAPGQESEAGYVDVVKAVRRDDGSAVDLAFDERGRPVEVDQLLEEVSRRRLERFGRLDETLWARIQDARRDESIDIVVWPRLDLPAASYEKPTDRRVDEVPDGERVVAEVASRAKNELRDLLKRARVDVNAADEDDDAPEPFIRARATAEQIRELAQNDVVGVIFFDDTTEVLDLGNSIAVARSDQAHTAGFDGTGIRAAVWETGPSVTTNLTFAGRFTATPGASNHARLTSAVVRNTETNRPHGHAPDCDLYSANASGVDALRWAAQQGCTVISQSFHRSSEPGSAGLQSDDLLKDWLALRWPYPTILQAAGNFWMGDPDNITPPADEYVNHKGYNSLAVGSHNDGASAMAGDSVFRNPSSPHGDRELPEIAANGTSVTANANTMSGTSFAAPAAAGVTALLQDVDGVLCSWPEGCRAILLASAGRNVEDRTWWQDVAARVDASDGAGAIDARAGVAIAQQRRWRDAPATRRGWDIGTLSSAVVGADRLVTFRHRVSVPWSVLFPTVKIAIAWDSAVTSSGQTATASRLTVDLDLIVRDSRGVQVATSASWDNSYEVVEFAANRGETYEIVIRRWSGTDSVWYGVAWTVTGFSFFDPLVATLMHRVAVAAE